MKINNTLDKFLNSSVLSTSIFIGSGVYKTCKDYKIADDKYKDKFLVKDCVVLAGASLGMLAQQAATKKIPKITMKNRYIEEMSKDFLSGFSLFASGIVGALSADYLLSKMGFKTPDINEIQDEKNKFAVYVDDKLDKISDEKTRNIVYSKVTDMPQMSVLTAGMIGAHAIDLAKEQEIKARLKNTTTCLINNSLLPLLFLTVSSVLTKGMKGLYRIPIVFGTLVGGTILINKITEENLQNKIKNLHLKK